MNIHPYDRIDYLNQLNLYISPLNRDNSSLSFHVSSEGWGVWGVWVPPYTFYIHMWKVGSFPWFVKIIIRTVYELSCLILSYLSRSRQSPLILELTDGWIDSLVWIENQNGGGWELVICILFNIFIYLILWHNDSNWDIIIGFKN